MQHDSTDNKRRIWPKSGIITSVLASLGIMLNIVAQILAANALLSSMFGLGPEASAIISVILMPHM